MSFILDALRKSELERQRQGGPSIAELPVARDDRRLPIALLAIGVLLAVNVAVLLFFLMRDGGGPAALPAPQPAATQPQASVPPAQAPNLPVAAATAPAAGAIEELEDEVAPDPRLLENEPVPAGGNVTYSAESAPPVESLPMADAAGLPELTIDLHIYTDDPAKRAVFINGRRYTEGATITEGPVVEQITADGAVLSHRGRRFQLSRH